MRDLLIIAPTRARPASAKRLAEAVKATCLAATDLIFAVDEDDLSMADVTEDAAYVVRGVRRTCGQWTNDVAVINTGGYRAFASLGDDHVPETRGWDVLLLAAVDRMGGCGISYGDDTLQHANLPTAPVVSSAIVRALGWMFLPGLTHFFADNVWKDLGRAAGCLAYVPEVTIRHLHYTSGLSPDDATYQEAAGAWDGDEATYRAWVGEGLAGDARKIRALRD
jgi:hypothetical protein